MRWAIDNAVVGWSRTSLRAGGRFSCNDHGHLLGRGRHDPVADDQHLALRLVLWKRHLVSPLLARHVRIVDRPTRISTARSKPANALGCGRPFGTQWCVAPVPFEFCFSSLQLSSPVVPICFDSNCSHIIRLSESDVGTYVYRRVGMSALETTFDGITDFCSSKPERMDKRGRCLSLHLW